MNTKQEIKILYNSLTSSHKVEIMNELLAAHELEGVVLKEAITVVKKKRDKKPCPHCHSTNVYRRGFQNGSQAYRCNDCNKHYRETTGTPLYRIQIKEKWQSYIDLMEKGLSLSKIAKELNISIQTSFDWRHKILSSLEQFIPAELCNTVECDEMEFSLSNKGERNLQRKPRKRANDFKRNTTKKEITVVQAITVVERDTGNKFFKVVESKRLTKEQIALALDGRLAPNTTLITDKHNSYKSYTNDNKEIKHKRLLAKDHVDKKDKTIHLQKVNNIHSQVRDFIRPFNGVSSKYLQNYLNWYAYKGNINSNKATIRSWLIALLFSSNAYSIFEQFKQNAMVIRT